MPTAAIPAARQAASTAVLTVPFIVMIATSSVSGVVIRRPPTIRVGRPIRSASAVVCGPPPCTTTSRTPSSDSTPTCSTTLRSDSASATASPPSFSTKTRPR